MSRFLDFKYRRARDFNGFNVLFMERTKQMQIPAPSDGYYFSNSSQTCVACSYWTREKKSCDAENAAAKAKTCHLHGENNLDKVCYSRQETQGVCVCLCVADRIVFNWTPNYHKSFITVKSKFYPYPRQ